MRKLIQFINRRWADPVWSKVFAAGIIALISSIALYLYSVLAKIAFRQLWTGTLNYLSNTYLSISYLALLIIAFILLIVLIPMISLKMIRFQLRHSKFPKNLKAKNFNFENFIQGKWELIYKHINPALSGSEILEIIDGTQYFINDNLVFVLTDIDFNENKNELQWTKVRYQTNKRHSLETLSVLPTEKSILGTDDLGYNLKYTKLQ